MNRSIIRKFLRNKKGNVAVVFAIAIVPIMAALTGAVEFTNFTRTKSALQDSLDSALVHIAREAAATTSEAALEEKGQSFFKDNIDNLVGASSTLDYLGVTTEADTSLRYTADVTKQYKGTLAGAFNGPFSVRSAVVRQAGANACLLALNPTAASSVDFNGTTDVELTACTIAANSKSATAITRSGAATIKAACIQTPGKTSGIVSDSKVTLDCPKAKENSFKTADPLASFTPPTAGACANLTIPGGNGNNWKDIYPGTYCDNSFTVNGGKKVRFNPGTYIFKGTDISFIGGAEIEGSGVTIFLYGGAKLNISANSFVALSAPTTGPNKGILVYSAADNPVGLDFAGGTNQKLQGFIYNPKGTIDFKGNAGTTADQCVRLIGDTIKMTGTSKLKVSCSTELGGRDIVTTKLIRFVE